MFGVPLTPSVRWSVDSDHAVLAMFALSFVLTPILLGHRFRMVHASMSRTRGRIAPPWYADARFVVGFSIGLIALIIGDLLLWSRVALLIGVAAEVALSAVLVRTVRLERRRSNRAGSASWPRRRSRWHPVGSAAAMALCPRQAAKDAPAANRRPPASSPGRLPSHSPG